MMGRLFLRFDRHIHLVNFVILKYPIVLKESFNHWFKLTELEIPQHKYTCLRAT